MIVGKSTKKYERSAAIDVKETAPARGALEPVFGTSSFAGEEVPSDLRRLADIGSSPAPKVVAHPIRSAPVTAPVHIRLRNVIKHIAASVRCNSKIATGPKQKQNDDDVEKHFEKASANWLSR